MSESITIWTVQKYNWLNEEWETSGEYRSDDSRGELNAGFSLEVLQAAEIPCRLLTDGVVTFSDDPETFYSS